MYDIRRDWRLVRSLVVTAIIFACTYAALYFAIGAPFAPLDGPCFAVVLLWTAAHVGGFLAVQLRLPALLGMLVMGLLLQNLPGEPLQGYPITWENKIKTFGLCTIMLRAGLKINYPRAFGQSRRAACFTVLLGSIPVICEALIVSLPLWQLFHFPYLLALTAGFLLAPLSPTIMVTGMLDLQKRQLGTNKAIPSMEMAASGLDVVLGVAGYSLFVALSIPQYSGNQGWNIAKGPMNIVLGAAASLLGGLVMSVTKIWNKPLKTAMAMFTLAQMFMFVFYKYKIGQGAGALAAIGISTVASLLWLTGKPRWWARGKLPNMNKQVDNLLAVLWMIVVQPLLFGSIGASVVFKNIPAGSVPKAVLVVFVGMFTRILTAGLVTSGSGLNIKEKTFVALSWIPKATVQGALSAVPLNLIMANMQGKPQYEQYFRYGQEILATAVIAIFITAPLGLMGIAFLSGRLLTYDPSAAPATAAADEGAGDVSRPSAVPGANVEQTTPTSSDKDAEVKDVEMARAPYFSTAPEGHMCDFDPLPMLGQPLLYREGGTQTDITGLYEVASHALARHSAPGPSGPAWYLFDGELYAGQADLQSEAGDETVCPTCHARRNHRSVEADFARMMQLKEQSRVKGLCIESA